MQEQIFILRLDLIQTLALAAALYYLGVRLKRAVRVLDQLNIPSAVVGGLIFAAFVLIGRDRIINFEFNTAAQPLFMVAFFTTIGMSASLPLLKSGGAGVLIFLSLSALCCVVQNFLGMAIAAGFGAHPLLGVMAGSVTLVGGPATGLAFAPLFETAGLSGAGAIAITAATFGIVCGGVAGGPVGTWLIGRFNLKPKTGQSGGIAGEAHVGAATISVDVESEESSLVLNLIVASVAMGLGSILSAYFQSLGWTLPAYIGAMLVASGLRNLDDVTGWMKIDQKAMELIGGISLNIFLVVALMNLKLWELAGLALPLIVILAAQVAGVIVFALAVFRVMRRDYDAAVMSAGFIGFALGTTANAVANMKTIVAKFGASPRAFLIVPMVGAFFIDFVNALIITNFLNYLE